MKHTSGEFDILKSNYRDLIDLKYQYAILPWGATEPHNYHLPYLTDCYLSHDIAVEAVNKAFREGGVRGMVLPPIPLGSQNPGQRELPFCLHARYETQKAILTDIVASLDYQGIHLLIIVNGHGGNSFKNMVRDLAVDFPHFTIIVNDWFSFIPQAGYFEEKDDHAGELETSVMMHYRPELVNLSVAGDGKHKPFNIPSLRNGVAWVPRNWALVSEDTGIGDPRKATSEKGKEYADAVTDKLADLFIELMNEDMY